jgi:hypothetical protein
MLKTLCYKNISNNQLTHFKAEFNQVLKERYPELVNWGPGRMPREVMSLEKT